MPQPDQSLLQSLSSEMASIVSETANGIVAIRGARTVASGIVWREGIVVSADESLDDVETFSLTLPDGSKTSAELAGRDPSTDVALFKVDGLSAPAWRHADKPPAGALALMVGRGGSGPRAAFGMVAESGGAWTSSLGGRIDAEIRLSLTLPRAIEGGAVVAADGSLVGLAATDPRRRGLAIPVATVERAVTVLLEKGYVARGFLGVGLHGARRGGPKGALVTDITKDGPADRAGLLIGDIITTWDGNPVRHGRDLWRRLGVDAVGQTVRLGIIRAGQPVEVSATIGERPPRG